MSEPDGKGWKSAIVHGEYRGVVLLWNERKRSEPGLTEHRIDRYLTRPMMMAFECVNLSIRNVDPRLHMPYA